jgi:predicted Zn-dependent protease
MSAARSTLQLGLRAALIALTLMLAACSSFMGPSVRVSEAGTGNAPIVPQQSSDPEDDAIGAREHPRIIAAYGGVYTDRKSEVMLAEIVSNLLDAAGQPNTRFTITILDSSEVNAFALPGGYVYVTRGIPRLRPIPASSRRCLPTRWRTSSSSMPAPAPTACAPARSSIVW